MQRVEVDHRDLVRVPFDPVGGRILGVPPPHQVAHPEPARVQPADEGRHGGIGQTAPPGRMFVLDVLLDELAQRFEVLHRVAAEDDRGVVLGVVQAVSVQVRLHPRHQVGDLGAFVLRLGEQEPEIPLPNELLHRPEVGGDPLGPALDLGEGGATDARAGRRPQADGGERTRLQPEALVVLPVRLGQTRVRLVEPHEVLALDVEHDGLGVRPRPAEHGGVEQGEQEEQRVRGLRRHPRDAADVEVGAPRSVEEVQVHEHRLSVPGQPRREPSLHLVEVQRLVPVLAPSAVRG